MTANVPSVDLMMTHRVRTKICGVTTPEDAEAAALAGADAVGLVFASRSRRLITRQRAREITRTLPPFVTRVALFADNDADTVRRVLDDLPVDLLQFHGSESPAFCNAFGRDYVRAVPMGECGVRLAEWADRYAGARALLLDANRIGEVGGQGRAFDWQAEFDRIAQPIIVAGGLTADNVGQAIARFRPYAVDVSSGVERAPGVKCRALMQAFVDAAIKAASQAGNRAGNT